MSNQEELKNLLNKYCVLTEELKNKKEELKNITQQIKDNFEILNISKILLNDYLISYQETVKKIPLKADNILDIVRKNYNEELDLENFLTVITEEIKNNDNKKITKTLKIKKTQ